MTADRMVLAITGVAATLLQLLLSPALTFGDATPSFIIVAVVSVIVLFSDDRHYLFAFIMGIIADLVSQAPVGATSFSLLVCAFLLPIVIEAIGNDNLLMTALVMLAGMALVLAVFCVFLAVSGVLGLVDGVVHVLLPCVVYDTLLAILVYIVCFRLFQGRQKRSGVTMSNVRFH